MGEVVAGDLASLVHGDGMSVPPSDQTSIEPGSAAVPPVTTPNPEPVNSGDTLGTRDLTFREIRDSLWLASKLRPRSAARSDPSKAQRELTPDLDALDDEPAEFDTSSDTTQREQWAPGPAEMTNGGQVPSVNWRRTAKQAWPTTRALPEMRKIARALRPMMRRHQSPWHRTVDEEATAVRAAQDGLWLPQWRYAPWRRFEVVLVVDTSASMEIWQQTVREFQTLLAYQGAFRNIRTYLVDTTDAQLAKQPFRAEGPGGRMCHWKHLVDPTGRRIVLVLTDGIGRAWHSGALSHVLYQWGQKMPVVIVQTMAQRLWSWSGLAARRMRLSAPCPGATNRQLRTVWSGPDPDLDAGERGMPVPVLGLSAEWMAGWARLLTAPGSEWIETTAVLVRPTALVAEPVQPDETLTAEKRVLQFRTIASVQAFRLAGLLAAVPLNMSFMQLVQRVLLPSSTLSDLAEVMLGGLLFRLPAGDSSSDKSSVSYEFIDGVREELLACGERADTARVVRVLNEYAGHYIPALKNYSDAIESPDDTCEPEPSPEAMPYVRVQAAVFRALSGPYQRRAKRLRRSLNLDDIDRFDTMPTPAGSVPEDAIARSTAVTSTSKSPAETSLPSPQPVPDEADVASGPLVPSARRPDAVSAPVIWGAVPLRNPDFVGRTQLLEQLRRRLTEPGTTAVLPEALHGMGGVGKSQTVVEYIYQHASEYEVVWWIPAEHLSQIKSSFIELAKRLGLSAASSADTAVPAVLEALRRGEPYSRWILVFDNADQPDHVRPFFPAGSGHIVVTSRNSEWGGFARSVEVDLFSRIESVELLHRRGGALDEADADRLAEALGDLPLAIEQAAAWRAQTGMQVSEYLELLEQNRTELLETGTTSDYQLPVAVAWNVTLNKLRNDHLAALQLLQVCAFFGPEPISRRLFIGIRDAPVPDALGEAFRDPIKLNRAIREISRYSLAKIDHRSNTLQLHRLVQTVLKNQLSDDEQEGMLHAVHMLLVNGDPGDPNVAENWTRYAELLPHTATSRAVDCTDRWVRQLILNLVRYLFNSGDYTGARDLAGHTVKSWESAVGPDDVDTLEITRQYGAALRKLGQVEEAMLLNQRTYESMRETFGEDHELVLGMLDSVAADRRSQGRFAEELQMQQEVYDRSRQVLGEDDPATLTYAHNLGGCMRLMGDFQGALRLDDDTLRRRTAVLGRDHLQTFGSRNAYAMDLREVGRYGEAAKVQQDTLQEQRKIFGDGHPSTLGAIRNLAVALRKDGQHEAARENAELCLRLYRRRYGDRHGDTATAQMTLSVELRILQQMDDALALAKSSYRLLQETMTDLHPYSLIAATNLAVIYRIRGDMEAARELNEHSYQRLREVFHSDHPFTLVSATNLASDLAEMGDLNRAKELDQDTVQRSTRVLGADHPATLCVALNLALDLANLGEEAGSAVLHSKTVAGLRATLGPNHPAVLSASQRFRANCDTDTMQL
jgi:tetratricopeptide (TPR) repeat protein